MQTMTALGLGAISLWAVVGALGVWARQLDNRVRAHQLNLNVVAELARRKPKYSEENPDEPNFELLDDNGNVMDLAELESGAHDIPGVSAPEPVRQAA